jgi:PHD/YefM family antitoxin component YafN of YafNO toxin-antitoxin module
MFDTVSISQLQKSAGKVLKNCSGAIYILSNNKKTGIIFNEEMLSIMEERGFLEELEDSLLAQKMKEAQTENQFSSLQELENAI